MIRMQVQFTEEQAERLRRAAAVRGTSISAVVRDAVDGLADDDERARKWERALAVVGKYASGGPGDVAERHDDYLDEIYFDWRSS